MQGHVDGVGTVVACSEDGFARRVGSRRPTELLRYVVAKGSIAVDGVSLTVAELDEAIVYRFPDPRDPERTNLGAAEPGRP